MVVSTTIFSQYKASASSNQKKAEVNEKHLQSVGIYNPPRLIPVFWLKSPSASSTRVVQCHFFSFLAMVQPPTALLSPVIWTYLEFLLPVLVLTRPQPLNRVPKTQIMPYPEAPIYSTGFPRQYCANAYVHCKINQNYSECKLS